MVATLRVKSYHKASLGAPPLENSSPGNGLWPPPLLPHGLAAFFSRQGRWGGGARREQCGNRSFAFLSASRRGLHCRIADGVPTALHLLFSITAALDARGDSVSSQKAQTEHPLTFLRTGSVWLLAGVTVLHSSPSSVLSPSCLPPFSFLISLSKSETTFWVRLNISYSFSALNLACAAETLPLSGRIL